MNQVSTREFIGLPVVDQSDHVIGTVETWVMDPKTKTIEGLLIGQTNKKTQGFVPLLCIDELSPGIVRIIHHIIEPPKTSQRIIGLPAWTTSPKFLAGFVHDCLFDRTTCHIATFVVHQVVRTWQVPSHSIVKIGEKALLIDTDTTVKLKLTPYPTL